MTEQKSMAQEVEAEDEARPALLFVAGFGDNSGMFSGLSHTHLADTYRLIFLDLPGFGAPPLEADTTLNTLAQFVAEEAKGNGAEVIVAHSVASIIASIAANQPDCPITTIISLEGNITAADAYFSGTAADYDNPSSFRAAFLSRLDEMSVNAPIIARYREAASQADPKALWQLGTDARRFSTAHVPGEILADAAQVTYLFNPANCPEATVFWLDENSMDRLVLENSSHWASVDQPEMLADKIAETFALKQSEGIGFARFAATLRCWRRRHGNLSNNQRSAMLPLMLRLVQPAVTGGTTARLADLNELRQP